EAKAARADLQQEAQFYGAMDGAGKFIRGDAMAGMIITLVNIIGGIALGMLIRNMEFGQAVDFYTILTVGDGLASQLPGLVVSVASGILVTKASSKRDLAEEVYSQIFGSKPTLLATGLLLLVFALVPGFPRIPFLILGGTFLFAAGRMKAGAAGEQREQAEIEREEPSEEERIEDLLHVDRLGIEIGYRLISIVDPGRHGSLLEHIAALRRQFAGTLGVVIPPIRVKDNVQLDPNEYRILLMGQEVGRGELRAGHYLAMDPTGSAPPVEGVETIEPSFGLPARWVSESNKEQAEILGYTAIDAPSVLITHLTEVLKRIAHELISRDDVQALLDNVKKANPAIVEEIIPNVLSTSQVQRVLTALLKERCSVRNLALILEAMADAADDSKEPRHLVESTRMRLARSIVEPYLDEQGDLHVATIQPHLEGQLLAALAGQGDQETIAQGMLAQFVDNTARVLAEFVRKGWAPVLVTRAGLRPYLSEAVVTAVPGSAVMSYQEISTVKQVDVAAQVSLEGAAA
ncbi:MAG: FHIPEP family type III secretion protein, partial [Planctomycetota bacterium]